METIQSMTSAADILTGAPDSLTPTLRGES